MSDHLPECHVTTYSYTVEAVIISPWTDPKDTNLGKTVEVTEGDCICPELRACEERIYSRDIFMDAWKKGYAEAKKKYSEYLNADDEGSYSAGFRDGHEFAKTTLLTFMQQEQFDEMMKALEQ